MNLLKEKNQKKKNAIVCVLFLLVLVTCVDKPEFFECDQSPTRSIEKPTLSVNENHSTGVICGVTTCSLCVFINRFLLPSEALHSITRKDSHMYAHMRIHTHVLICRCICIHTRTHHTYEHTDTYVYTDTYTHIQI